MAPLQELLSPTFPYMEQEKVQELSFAFGPGGAGQSGSAESVTWKFTNDQGEMLAIGAGTATLSSDHSYGGVERFSERFELLLNALAAVRVPRCDRIGVRYLSIAPSTVGMDRAWRNWFKPELTGWTGSDVIGEGCLTNSISQVQLKHPATGDMAGPPADIQAVVRHGAVPPGTGIPGIPPITVAEASYLLDVDAFVAGSQPFDPTSLTQQFLLLHGEIDRFFFWSLTDDGKTHFGYSDADS